ncbi:hypothetical protein ABZ934_00315 [Streptomyces sp. NPDC046557]
MKQHCSKNHAVKGPVTKALCLGITAVTLLVIAAQYPDIKRYLRIRSM